MESGEKLLQDTNGYENYLSKDELRNLATIEGNLIYLAENKKLSTGNIYSIAMNHPVSENTLVALYHCGAITLRQVEQCTQKKGMDFNEIKEKIKEANPYDLHQIDITKEETWELLTEEEKRKATIMQIEKENSQAVQERINQLYDIHEIAELYRQIYVEKNPENREKYIDLIKLHIAIGNDKNDEIVNLLEEELSNEMLMNLYQDSLINVDILESYGEKELVIEAFHQGKIQDKDVIEVIRKYPIKLEEKELNQLLEKKLLTTQDMIDFYVEDKVKLDTMKKVNETLEEDQKIENFLSEERLINFCHNNKEKNNMKYGRYKLLYLALKREKLEEREKVELDKKIIEKLEDISRADLVTLYQDNLLTLETILNYGGHELVKELAIKGQLKPSDAKRYFEAENKSFGIEEILANPEMDDTEKMILIFSTYEDDKEKRDNLVKYLQAHATDIKGDSSSQRKEPEDREKQKSKKTITDPYERWKLFATLDKNYTKKYVDGYLIVHLNNTQKTIVEKMYQKENNKVVPAYGTATFALDTEEYEKIQNELIQNNRFKVTELRKKAKENPEDISKITHHAPTIDAKGKEKSSWGKRLLEKICEEEMEEVYTPEEIAEIEKCMNDIEKSRQEWDR